MYLDVIEFASKGATLGFAAGFAPGPLFALVLSETLNRGKPAGIKVAIAPLITDPPIIAVSLALLGMIVRVDVLLGIIGIAGGFLLLYLGWQTITADPVAPRREGEVRSIRQGVLVNMMSPHPYLFWTAVGGPLLLSAWQRDATAAVLFLFCFYSGLVGSKIALACAAAKSKKMAISRFRKPLLRILGLMLGYFALELWRESFRLLQAF